MKLEVKLNQIEDVVFYHSSIMDDEGEGMEDMNFFFTKKSAIDWTKRQMESNKIEGNPEDYIEELHVKPSKIRQADIILPDWRKIIVHKF
jgi:hypothetical protein